MAGQQAGHRFFNLNLNNMDQILNQKIRNFLALSSPDDAQIRDAATILLQLSPASRHIFNGAMTHPQSMLPWIREDLRKYLKLRTSGMTRQQVAEKQDVVLKGVRRDLARRPEGVKPDELPLDRALPVTSVRKRRDDHDSLPDDIRAIWDNNAERYRKMRRYHAQLMQMVAQPNYQACDGAELCNMLADTADKLRKDYARYDSYGTTEQDAHQEDADDPVKKVNRARACITRTLQVKNKKASHVSKMQEAYDTLLELGQDMKPDTIKKLKQAGVKVKDA